MPRLTIRIEFENGRALGPGKIRLLEQIGQEGSIRGAARAMKMSYRRAWLLIHDVEAMMGTAVIAAESGGARGGGTTLTANGRAVIEHYRSLEVQAAASVDVELRALSRMARTRVGARGASARSKRSAPKGQKNTRIST